MLNGAVHHLCEENGQKTPGNGGAEADIPLHVEFLVAVIPVFHFKQLFHAPAGDVFQNGGGDNACQVHQKQVVLDREGYPQHHHGACSIQGKQGKAQKTAVHKVTCFRRNIGGFKNPPEKAVYKKECKPLIPRIFVHINHPLRVSFMILFFLRKCNLPSDNSVNKLSLLVRGTGQIDSCGLNALMAHKVGQKRNIIEFSQKVFGKTVPE